MTHENGGARERPTFTCPRCGMTSAHPDDVRQGYCGQCHDWTARGGVFGEWDAPITDDADPIDTPIGATCTWCRDAIKDGDNGRVDPRGNAEHRECGLRSVIGGIGHHVNHSRYCRGIGPDAGLTYRQSALLVWDFFQQTRLQPTAEQQADWRAHVEELSP